MTVSITLKLQSMMTEHRIKNAANRITKYEKSEGWGKQVFISNEGLHMTTQTCQFLKDNSLFFQINFKALQYGRMQLCTPQ